MIDFTFPITVEQEVPEPTIPGIQPAGVGFVTYDTDSNEVSWVIHYAGLTGPIVSPGAHFHGPADFGVTAGAVVSLVDSLPQPANGTLTGSTEITEAQEADLLAGLWYVNIHTELNPAGEIRGQVVPEPAGLALIGIAGAVIASARKGRR
jgi:hypothetical protein